MVQILMALQVDLVMVSQLALKLQMKMSKYGLKSCRLY